MSNSMTPERAIEVIKDELPFESGVINEALRIIEQVIEYRTPKKPLVIKNNEDVKIGAGTWKAGVSIYKCSCCNAFINYSSNFCSNCGQALDWRDEE